ncbi:biotin transporter BioY [Fodinisporobacter ferrooxydans]|uniref:Biotin transporter n=1 Tax=Fodinisporobacter ferrooxydans TaxID=2901836 RepID=A0ABY4CKI2_9BACL|nr:biotin transporter BioY [Alicyclobacillaceae bacterium MYW30-H2]
MREKFTIRGIIFSALFAAIFSAASFLNIHLGFSPVPITLENLVVMLTGAFLGAGYGFFSMLLIVVLTTLGLPLIHGSGGLALILGPTGGFIWMYPISAMCIGFIVERLKSKPIVSSILMFLSFEIFGSLVLYVTGVPWLAHVAGLSFGKAMLLGCYPYLPGDAIKALIATSIAVPISQVYPIRRLIGKQDTNVVIAK